MDNLRIESQASWEKFCNDISLETNHTESWRKIKNFLKSKGQRVYPALRLDAKTANTNADKAQLFAESVERHFSILSNIIEDIEVSPRKILELIRRLDSNKAHGCDDVSIAMLKICDEAIVLPLQIIYTNCLEKGVYPNLWKRANVLPIHKKKAVN